jgi:hypothetical protein
MQGIHLNASQKKNKPPMVATSPMVATISVIEKQATNGRNFTNWALNLRILLNASQKGYVLEAPLGNPPAEDALDEGKNVF